MPPNISRFLFKLHTGSPFFICCSCEGPAAELNVSELNLLMSLSLFAA